MLNNKEFIKSITKYFMDFLETDFHNRKSPRRKVDLADNNILLGLNLNKYPSFYKEVYNKIESNFDEKSIVIKKNKYKSNIDKRLIKEINDSIDLIDESNFDDMISLIDLYLKKTKENTFEEEMSAEIKKIIYQNFIEKIFLSINPKIEKLNLDEQTVNEMVKEIVDSVYSYLDEIIKQDLNSENNDKNIKVENCVKYIEIIGAIKDYFENYETDDLFYELYKMNVNKKTMEKKEFYIYFYDITYKNEKYPMFYIPFEISIDNKFETITMNFNSVIYINKKAIEYIVQEVNLESEIRGELNSVKERIVYLSEDKTVKDLINSVILEIANLYKLKKIEKDNRAILLDERIKITDDIYVSIFDKGDEALINDYEELLEQIDDENSEISLYFEDVIDNFLNKNPINFYQQIDEEWDNRTIGDKLVFETPIPLNSEQIKILNAINKDGCKYITIQGPPGTGKSHTITAIAFNMILKNKKILVLSDKKEALDVVEDKISQTLNKVRTDNNFQNPVLRLDKNNYGNILAPEAVEKINMHYKAVKREYDEICENITKISNSLKEDIENEILLYSEIDISEIQEIIYLEEKIGLKYEKFIEQFINVENSYNDLDDIKLNYTKIYNIFDNNDFYNNMNNYFSSYDIKINKEIFNNADKMKKYINYFDSIKNALKVLKEDYQESFEIIQRCKEIDENQINNINSIIDDYEKQKNTFLGFIFAKKKLSIFEDRIKRIFPNLKNIKINDEIQNLEKIVVIYNKIEKQKNIIYQENGIKVNLINIILNSQFQENNDLEDIYNATQNLKNISKKYEKLSKDVNYNNLNEILSYYKIILDTDFDELIRYLMLMQGYKEKFNNIPISQYIKYKNDIEKLTTLKMTYILDKNFIDFYFNNKNTARDLRNIIQKKQKFPKEKFIKLKEAFPCILASIRDYAEYIPLSMEEFDMVIIDEASQVSIAQAFPAILRAKQVLVLGDKKQFSNVKSNQARTEINKEYQNKIEDAYKKTSYFNNYKIEKLEKFNIKSSILDFLEYISNYNAMLYKHFRSYKEIIGYSNKYFYKDSLQIMKIRGKSIDDVIKFIYVDYNDDNEIPNTNKAELEYIINELKKLKNSNIKSSVGIITPHTNQRTLINNELNKLPEYDYFEKEMNIKVMTFDSCQGEERDIIFYSMVANKESDRLSGIFIKDLSKIDIEEDGKIRAQRLNVGFSRAKEEMIFILSKPIDEFNGEIGNALRYYENIVEESKKEKDINSVDKKSMMEPQVMNWFYQTDFWKNNSEKIEFIPQFEIGKYLKQLDLNYEHPNYKVDFLLIYKSDSLSEKKIIIEYDGFKEHFTNINIINKYNYKDYYNSDDIYRQRILEGYGYKFLRINKFNIGDNPIVTLNERINEILDKNKPNYNNYIDSIKHTVLGLENGDKIECPRCKLIKDLIEFKDESLISGYGKICNECKNKRKINDYPKNDKNVILCSCGAKMVLRHGKYGNFYGCSRYPYCKNTKNI